MNKKNKIRIPFLASLISIIILGSVIGYLWGKQGEALISKGENMTYEQYKSEYESRRLELVSTANRGLMIVFSITGLLIIIGTYEYMKKTIIKIFLKDIDKNTAINPEKSNVTKQVN